MFLSRLKTTSPITIVFYMMVAVLFCFLPLFQHTIDDIYNHAYFTSTIVFLLGILIPILQSIGLNNLIYEKDVIKKSSLVVAPVFLLLCTPFLSQADAWIVSFLLIFYLNTIFGCFQKDKPFSLAFNTNFLLSTIALFYADIILLFPLIIVAFLTFSNLTWRSFLIAIIGLALPILLYWIYTFLFDLPFNYRLPSYKLPTLNLPTFNELAYAELAWYIVVATIIILSFLELFFWMYKKSLRSRKSFFIILAYLLLLVFVNFDNSYFLTLTPIAVIVANFFVYSKRTKLTEILFFLFVITSFYYRLSI